MQVDLPLRVVVTAEIDHFVLLLGRAGLYELKSGLRRLQRAWSYLPIVLALENLL